MKGFMCLRETCWRHARHGRNSDVLAVAAQTSHEFPQRLSWLANKR